MFQEVQDINLLKIKMEQNKLLLYALLLLLHRIFSFLKYHIQVIIIIFKFILQLNHYFKVKKNL